MPKVRSLPKGYEKGTVGGYAQILQRADGVPARQLGGKLKNPFLAKNLAGRYITHISQKYELRAKAILVSFKID